MTKPLEPGERQRRFIERKQRELAIYNEVKEGIEAGSFKMDVYEQVGRKYQRTADAIYQTYMRVKLRRKQYAAFA